MRVSETEAISALKAELEKQSAADAFSGAALVAKDGKVVLVTSATPAQGKSLIAANLSYLMAAGGGRVLLIDADIRRRSLGNYLPIPRAAKGLTDVLASTEQAASCVLADLYSLAAQLEQRGRAGLEICL